MSQTVNDAPLVQLDRVGILSSAVYADVGDAISEKEITGRFSRRPKPFEDLQYEFTRDPALLHQYYRIREQMYMNVLGLKHFKGAEDECDRRSHILIMRNGNQVIGGARITVRSPRQPYNLPMEQDDFCLGRILPELSLQEKKYAEFSRLALLPEYHGGVYAAQIYQHLNRKSIALGLDYVFAIATFTQARNYRRSYVVQGYDYKILENVTVPEKEIYEGIRMCLSVLNLKAQQQKTEYGTSRIMKGDLQPI